MNQTGIFRALAGALIGSAATFPLLVAGPAQSATVTIDGGSACATWIWSDTTRTLSCGATPPPPVAGAPTGCQPAISTQTLPSGGGTVNLSVSNCTASGAITYAWTKNGSAASISQNWTDTLSSNSLTTAVTTTYYVNACNGSACTGNLPSSGLTVSVAAGSTAPPPPPPPPSGTNNLCAQYGFSKTIYYNWDWSGAQVSKLDTISMSDMAGGAGLGTNGILVVAFTPNFPADLNNLSAISVTGYPSPNMTNYLTLAISEQPCDLNPPAPAASTSSSATVAYGIGKVPVYWSTGAKVAAELTPGRQYYINVAGRDSIGPSTPYGLQTCVPGLYYPACEIRLGLQKPPGH